MNVSCFDTQKVYNASNLSEDDETKGFDLEAGQSWIYPTNFSFRDYQYNIIQQALHKNTLVSLPTGLGKTFIAAVVMYNFYRWYPYNKVIFMAPTRPLVKQQMDACYNITAIPQDATAELTGTKDQQSRAEIWQAKRVFFITPQVLQNDLNIILELGTKIKCLVFDEAHRAKGNHAYCEVIRKLLPKNKLFRVLALSATPGNSSRDVIEVMQNLLISHVEFRSEESPDVKPYVFQRSLETVVVPLGEKLQQIKDDYIQILEKYTRTLLKYKVIYGNCTNLTKGKIFMVMKEFQARNAGSRNPNYGEIMKSLNICVTLYHAFETLIRCGLRAFLNFYEEHISNPLLSGNMNLRQILDDLRNYIGPNPDVKPLPDGSFTEIPPNSKFGHPKFYTLQDILSTHFKNGESSTRVIVFFEYRESASEAYALLSKSYPTIRSRVFVGQGSGVTQKDQINTIKAFREGICNTLLSTCIGEEGLDVGDVDLIVCFDVANKSPIRMIQRMGRTGRKKEGRVVVLVTEGKEQQTLKECLIYKNNLGNFASNPEQLESGKYQENPKMIPSHIQPKCQKMYITVKKPTGSKNLKDMFKRIAAEGPNLGDYEIVEIEERLNYKSQNLFDKINPLNFNMEKPKIHFGKYLEKQRSYQDKGIVKNSKQSEILVSLLQFADSKRYNLPVSEQIGGFSHKILKQGDIRSMFVKPQPITLSQEPIYNSQFGFDKEKDLTQSFPQELFEEISAFVSIHKSETCKTCNFLFKCPKVDVLDTEKLDFNSFIIPDLSILNIGIKDFELFSKSLTPKSKEIFEDFMEENDAFFGITFSEANNYKNKTISYETPRNFDKILKNFQIEEVEETKIEKSFAFESPKNFAKIVNLFENVNNENTCVEKIQNKVDLKELLDFFKLKSIEDIFEKKKDHMIIHTPEIQNEGKDTSPDLFDSPTELFPSSEKKSATFESPTLCSFERVQSAKAKKRLFDDTKIEKPNLDNLKLDRKSFFESTRTIKNSVKKQFDFSDICDFESFFSHGSVAKNDENKQVSPLVVTEEKPKSPIKIAKKNQEQENLDISDLCDLSAFGLVNTKVIKTKQQKNDLIAKNEKRILALRDFCDFSNFFAKPSETTRKNDCGNFDQLSQASTFFEKTSPRSLEKSDIDLTDRNGKLSPEKLKCASQLTVTQMVSLIGKTCTTPPQENCLGLVNKTKSKLSLSGKKVLDTKKNFESPKSSQKSSMKSNTPKAKKLLNISLAGDSDDEFEATSSPVFAKPKFLSSRTQKTKTPNAVLKSTKKPKKLSDFIEHEAEVSDDEKIIISDDEDSGEDAYEASFIADETQDLNNTSLHVKYLQSVKSPANRGAFKIPNKFRDVGNVFSQEVSNEDNSYINDSFCVDELDDEENSQELTQLEILELKLKKMNKKKRKMSAGNSISKRRRIILPEDSD